MAANLDRAKEQRYYGRRFCAELFKQRPQDIISVSLHKSLVHEFGYMLKWCAEHRKAYHLVDNLALEKMTSSNHHEGIVVLARKRLFADEAALQARLDNLSKGHFIALDGVENPHNLGALIRTAAHFGSHGIIIASKELNSLPAASCRISEGGSELVEIYNVPNLVKTLNDLKSHSFVITATSAKSKINLFAHNFAEKCCVVFGSETNGISKQVNEAADVTIQIPGSGAISSLNVASAASIVLSEYYRKQLS